jgi:Domain of unknown function (DUF3291)
MSTKRVALYTFGMFIEPSKSPINDGFHARNDINFLAAGSSEGFIARSGYDGDLGPKSWGEHIYPRFYNGTDDHSPSTLSLWTDIVSPMAFIYAGIHADAMRHGRQWFQKPQWPGYVLWWVDQDHTPEWAEGAARHEHLHDHGPSPHAFSFKAAFDGNNLPTAIDRDALKRIIDVNIGRQQSLLSIGTHL